MPQLDPTWFASQVFWLVLGFFAMYFLLSRLILPPLEDVLARRKETIEGDISAAERIKRQAEHARQDYERTLADARERAQQLLNDVESEFDRYAEQSNKDLDRQLEAKLKEASRSIASRKKELMTALSPAAEELTALIVEKLTQQADGSKKHYGT